MTDPRDGEPDHTAVRVALWRARHVEVDAAPPVFDDQLGLRLVDPDDDWRRRPDMDPDGTRGLRAAIVSRARFVEDLLEEQSSHGVDQYVVLGAGLDTFAQRRPDLASRFGVFEVEQPATQAWKRRRWVELGYQQPSWLHHVPVDFEAGQLWREQLVATGFDPDRPALVASTGVTMYLTRSATATILDEAAGLAAGSTLAMTFLVPPELVDDADRAGLRESQRGASAAGTSFVSFYTPDEMLALARGAGFRDARHLAGSVMAERYFRGRPDGLRPSSGEDILLATT